MKSEELSDALNDLPDDLIASTQKLRAAGKRSKQNWSRWLALAACIALLCFIPLTYGHFTAPKPSAEFPAQTASPSQNVQTKPEYGPEAEDAPNASVENPRVTAELLETTIGPLKLGMTQEEVESLLGKPTDVSSSGAVEMEDGSRMIGWFYLLKPGQGYLHDVQIGFTDLGEGWRLDDLMLFSGCDWRLSTGIGIGSSESEVRAAYPEATVEEENNAGMESPVRSCYCIKSGHLELRIWLEAGEVRNISLGSYYEPPEIDWDAEPPRPPYSFASGEITIYEKTEEGWRSMTVYERQSKRIEIIMGIEELKPANDLRPAVYYIDFHNGTIATLCGDDERGAVYTIDDPAVFEAAMQEGKDPISFLTLQEECYFPAGTWESVTNALKREE